MTSVLVVSDIFGRCDGLQCLCADLASVNSQFRIIDPYQGLFQRFATEEEAYAAFTEQCGHAAYTELVQKALQQKVDIAIGFSAGASALWRSLGDNAGQAKQARLYYPGQLHFHLDRVPQLPMQLVFGATEHHFNVDDLLLQLANDSHVCVEKTPWQHGFMNLASASFSHEGYQQQVLQLKQLLTD
ncbi:MAG TPA: hypothetical protein VLA40_07355 [Rheinheimera sp.]|nr:hypothetical protein [Rheinheimera sp.]